MLFPQFLDTTCFQCTREFAMFIGAMTDIWRSLWLHLLLVSLMITIGSLLMTPKFALTTDGTHILRMTLLLLAWRSANSSVQTTNLIRSITRCKHNSFSSRSKAWKWLIPSSNIAICLRIGVSNLLNLDFGEWACKKLLVSSYEPMILLHQWRSFKIYPLFLDFVLLSSNCIFFQERLLLDTHRWRLCKLSFVLKKPLICTGNLLSWYRSEKITRKYNELKRCTEVLWMTSVYLRSEIFLDRKSHKLPLNSLKLKRLLSLNGPNTPTQNASRCQNSTISRNLNSLSCLLARTIPRLKRNSEKPT